MELFANPNKICEDGGLGLYDDDSASSGNSTSTGSNSTSTDSEMASLEESFSYITEALKVHKIYQLLAQ